MTEAGIDGGWNRDLFVAMGEPLGDGSWSLRLQYKPMVRFIWLGALVIAIGGFIAVCDRRYRQRVAAEATSPAQRRHEHGVTRIMWRFVIPIGLFATLAAFLFIGLGPRQGDAAVAADRQAGAAVRAAARRRSVAEDLQSRARRPAVRREHLGQLVRGVPEEHAGADEDRAPQ